MSEFKFACPVCGQHIKCDAARSGSVVECPTCFQQLRVPEPPKGNGSSLLLTASLANGRRYPIAETKTQPAVLPRDNPRTVPALALLVLLAAVLAGAAWMWREKIFSHTGSPAARSQTAAPLESAPPAPPDTNWTLNLAEAIWPNAPVSGRIKGHPFSVGQARLRGGTLELRRSDGFPETTLIIQLFARQGEDLARQKILIEPVRTNAPRVQIRTRTEDGRSVTDSFTRGYALRLEFGTPRDRRMPGQLYFAAPDTARSWAAGTFEAEIRNPPPPKTGPAKQRR